MVFENDQQVIAFVKMNLQVPAHIQTARKETKRLKALIKGKNFKEVLINKIEKIEDSQKAIARKKYSRAITDFFERLLRPVDNVYHSTGGTKDYNIQNQEQKSAFIRELSNVRGGLSLERWLERHWMPQYHSDPSGIIFIEYTTEPMQKAWPTYKSINVIRNYKTNGRKLEVIIFEPFLVQYHEKECEVYRVVDDVKEYFVLCHGDSIRIIDKTIEGIETDQNVITFEHPFGRVPALVNSDMVDIDEKPEQRLSPIWPIQPLCEEIARDVSILTIFKFQKGFPDKWMYVQRCFTCSGTGKVGDSNCPDCNGKGVYLGADITDKIMLEIPRSSDEPILSPPAGYVSVDGDFWELQKKEIVDEQYEAIKTHWGSEMQMSDGNKTATEIFVNTQPVISRLMDYSVTASTTEAELTELLANFWIPSKNKEEKIAIVTYGTNFIIETPESLLERYNESKKNEDNNVILDRLFREYITAKFKNDPVQLRIELKKSEIEPYLHLSNQQTKDFFGNSEAQKKVLFQKWWLSLTPEQQRNLTTEQLQSLFDTWLIQNQVPVIVPDDVD